MRRRTKFAFMPEMIQQRIVWALNNGISINQLSKILEGWYGIKVKSRTLKRWRARLKQGLSLEYYN